MSTMKTYPHKLKEYVDDEIKTIPLMQNAWFIVTATEYNKGGGWHTYSYVYGAITYPVKRKLVQTLKKAKQLRVLGPIPRGEQLTKYTHIEVE